MRDIAATRKEMSDTVGAIEERLSPARLKKRLKGLQGDAVEHMIERTRETVRGTGASLLDTARNNPIPLALIGIGVGLLIANRVRTSRNDDSRIRARTKGVAAQTRKRAAQVKEAGVDALHRSEKRIGGFAHDNPLALGAIALAAGAAVGLALPSTRFEDRLVGKSRQRVVRSIEGAAREVLEAAESNARSALGQAEDADGEGEVGDAD